MRFSVILVFLCCCSLYGQQLQFEQLRLPEGARARSIIQDRQGFLWFGTDISLLRFDGYEFKEFRVNPYDSLSLQTGKFDNIVEDFEGHLWFNSFENGLYRFDPVTETFHHYYANQYEPNSLGSNSVFNLLEDSNQRLWICTRGGLQLYNPEKDNFEYFYNPADSNQEVNMIFQIFEFEPGVYWAFNPFGHVKFTYETNTWELIAQNPGYYRYYRDYKDRIWTSKWPDLMYFDHARSRFEKFQYANPQNAPGIFNVIGNGKGLLYMGAFDKNAVNPNGGGGLAVLDQKSRIIKTYLPQINNPHSIKDGELHQIIYDRSGILWATHGPMSGSSNIVEKYDSKKYINHYINYLPEKNKSTDLVVNAIQINDQNPNIIWIGTLNGGLIKFNRETEEKQQYLYDPENPGAFGWPHAIYAIYQDKYGIIWAGSWSSGLYKLNPKTGEWKNYKNKFEENSLAWGRIGSLFEDSNGYLWIGCLGNGLNRVKLDQRKGFEREIEEYERIRYDPENERMQMHGQIVFIQEDRFQNVWFSTGNGLFRYITETNDFDKFLEIGQVYRVLHDSKGDLWAGTLTGLFKAEDYNPTSTEDDIQFQRFEIDHEWEGKPIAFASEDHEGRLWGAVNEKILRYDPGTGSYTLYDEGDGVLSGIGLGDIHSSGLLATGGTNGFIVFHTDSIKENTYMPPVLITDFTLDNHQVWLKDSLAGKPILSKAANYIDKITLPFGHNFGFKFVALNYTNTPKNQYQFMLEGFDDEWSPPSTTRTASYTNLWEGDYIFRVKGSNNDGVWNMEGASIHIAILPPWYRGKIAWIIYGGLLVMALVYARKLIVQREREKARLQMDHLELEKAQEMDQMKTQFFTNISHEFRTPLTLILGPLRQMKEGTFKGDVDSVINVMIRNSKRLLHLINQLLDFSKLESGAVSLQASVGDLVEFVRSMFATFESTAQSREIRYVFTSDVTSLPTYYDRDKLEKVIINLLSNAFKFTRNEGSIQLTMTRNIKDAEVDKGEGVVEIKIEDNGKGIDPDILPHIFDRFYQADASSTRQQEGTGIGLALAKELVELHYGTIRATSKKGKGTAFIVHLPLGREHLDDAEVVVRKGYHPIDTTAVESLPEGATIPLEQPTADEDLPLVLIIDDNEDMRLYLREILGGQYRMAEAANGQKGWEYAKEHIPDLVLSDVMMPEMDGQELCQKLKTDEHTSHIPVILLTARAGEKAKLEGLETGADDYVTKPFSPEELRARIHNLIELRQKLREQFSQSVSLEPADMAITSADERFLQRAMDIMEIHRSDSGFSAEDFIREIGMSRTQLHRKLKALTDQSANEFIRSYRLKYARQLIEKEYGNMAQVAYECGFNNPSYFAECFKKQFGELPSEFAKSNS